jgi:hypothetical protein
MLLPGAALVVCAGPLAVTGAAEAGVAPGVSVSYVDGWRKALKVPGLGALNKDGDADVGLLSCASAASCAAGGIYLDGSAHYQGFVVTEKNGRWGKAIKVPGLVALNKEGLAGVNLVSCRSAGNCAAGGSYLDGSGHSQGFVVAEKNGRWRKAIQVPGLGALNKGGDAGVDSLSCASADSCAAGGSYENGSEYTQGFVVSRT